MFVKIPLVVGILDEVGDKIKGVIKGKERFI